VRWPRLQHTAQTGGAELHWWPTAPACSQPAQACAHHAG
jgi:hypothetical protein